MKAKLVPSSFFLLVFVVCIATTVFAQEKTVTVITETEWHQNRVNITQINKRIIDAAEQYKEYAPIPRIAFYDIAFPKDNSEFEQLNGNGLLLITAMSQDSTELPLKRTYVVSDGKTVELKPLKQVLSKEGNLEGQIVKTFGTYRMDSLYLFPVYLRFQPANVLIDFATNRNSMKNSRF